jgi:hypothetical protein
LKLPSKNPPNMDEGWHVRQVWSGSQLLRPR